MEGIDVDAEQLQARAAADVAFADEEAVADLFMDFEDDAADAMVTALTRAGVAPEQARIAAIDMNQRAPTPYILLRFMADPSGTSRSIPDETSISRVWMHWTYAPQNPTASHGISQRKPIGDKPGSLSRISIQIGSWAPHRAQLFQYGTMP